MRAIFVQISGLIGVITFLNHLWSNASVERTVFVSLAVGLVIYFMLMTGDYFIQQILKNTASTKPEDAKVKDQTITSKPANTAKASTAKANPAKAETAQA